MKKRGFFGFGFASDISKTAFSRRHFRKIENVDWEDKLLPNFVEIDPEKSRSFWRVTIFAAIFLICFFALFLRLFHLQIVQGKVNRGLADGNRIQVKIIHAPRGVIFDKNGVILASNSPGFRLTDERSKKTKLISREQALELEVKNDPKYYNLEIDNVRIYPKAEKFAHVLGYVGEISEEELSKKEYKGYKSGDRIGKSGIEAEYEKVLRGVDGGEIIEIDSRGEKLRTLRINPPTSGKNVYLSIDASLQERMFDLTLEVARKANSCCAAAIAQNPGDGQILALVSIPSFDPNIFTAKPDEVALERIFLDQKFPLLNRAISGTYPPGSTYKIISALAGLSSNKISKDTIIQDNGLVQLGDFKFTNWYFTQYGRTEGPVDLVKALKRSNDIYFYEIGRRVGEEQIIDLSRKLKLGSVLGIDIPSEASGLVPTDEWKRKTYGEVWYPGDTLHLYIGQGFILTTPLQVLSFTSYIAGDGNLYKPHLVSKIAVGDKIIEEFKSRVLVSKIASLEDIRIIQEGLKAVTSEGGTAWPFFTFPIKTAGKTGTAEYGDPKGKTHAWYTGYGPLDDPKIAMTVLIEGGGEGSSVASPVVKEAFRYYFSEDKNNLIKDIYYNATESGRTLGE